jgi:hypothetical protein
MLNRDAHDDKVLRGRLCSIGDSLGTRRKRKQRIGVVIKVTAAILLVAAAAVVAVWSFYRTPPKSQGMQEFFSDDDGTTWFADDGTKVAPFDHNGKPAVLVKVYESGSGKQFVGYMMKFTDEARDQIVHAQKTPELRAGPSAVKGTQFNGLLVKKPHAGEWVPDIDPKAREVRAITCPDGSADYTLVRP